MVYVVTTIFLFLVEMLCWGLRTSYLEHRSWVQWIGGHMPQDPVFMLLHHLGRTLKHANTGKFTKAGRTHVKRILRTYVSEIIFLICY